MRALNSLLLFCLLWCIFFCWIREIGEKFGVFLFSRVPPWICFRSYLDFSYILKISWIQSTILSRQMVVVMFLGILLLSVPAFQVFIKVK